MANTGGIRAGRAFVELGANDAKLQKALSRAQQRMRAFGAGVASIGGKIAAGGAAMLSPFALSTRAFMKNGDELDKMSKRTGVSVEALSELGYAAGQSGTDLETLEKGVRTMQRTINDAERGLATANDALGELGLSLGSLQGLTPEQQFKAIADSLSRIEDPGKRAAIAMQIFGRAGSQLLPLMRDGAAGIEEMQERARKLGLTISTETAADAAVLTDAVSDLRAVLKATSVVIGAAVAPFVLKLTRVLTDVAVATNRWIRENREMVIMAFKVAIGVFLAGVAITALGVAIIGASAVLGLMATAVGAVSAAISFMLSPITLAVAAVAALGVAILHWSGAGGVAIDWLRDQFGRLGKFVSRVIGGIADAIQAGDISLAMEILVASLKVVWFSALDSLYGKWVEIRTSILNNMVEWWTGLQSAWSIGIAALLSTWLELKHGTMKIWNDITDYVAKKMLDVYGLFDEDFDVRAAKEIIDEQAVSRQRDQVKGLADDLSDVDAKLEESLGKYVDAEANLKDAIAKNASDDVKRLEADLAEAKRKLEESLKQASERRSAAEEGGTTLSSRLAEYDGMFDGIVNSLNRVEVRGTFNAGALQGLQGGASSSEERVAKGVEETARNTKRLLDEARSSGGLTFG